MDNKAETRYYKSLEIIRSYKATSLAKSIAFKECPISLPVSSGCDLKVL